MNKKGIALIEVIIAVAVMAMLIGGIMQGLNMSIVGAYKDSRFNTALHLAQSQMEYVKSLPFNAEINTSCSCSNKPPEDCSLSCYNIVPEVPEETEGFDIELTVDNGDEGNGYEYGISGLQLITVTVTCESNNVMLQEYKIDR